MRFIIGLCTVILYVIIPQTVNVIGAWGNIKKMVENIAVINISIMMMSKIIVTWYYSESKFIRTIKLKFNLND